LRTLLARETSIGVRSFVGQYLPILDFPRDVREPLERGDINLFEAHQLARLTAKRLSCTDAEARTHRRKLLEAHLLRQEPGPRLRERVKEALGELREPDPVQTEMVAVGKADELLEADPLDSSHLFFEELRRIGRALREMKPEELTDEDVDELMPAVDQVSVALMQIERRRLRRQEGLKKLRI
jgi:phosphoenolpyruvate carboxylase